MGHSRQRANSSLVAFSPSRSSETLHSRQTRLRCFRRLGRIPFTRGQSRKLAFGVFRNQRPPPTYLPSPLRIHTNPYLPQSFPIHPDPLLQSSNMQFMAGFKIEALRLPVRSERNGPEQQALVNSASGRKSEKEQQRQHSQQQRQLQHQQLQTQHEKEGARPKESLFNAVLRRSKSAILSQQRGKPYPEFPTGTMSDEEWSEMKRRWVSKMAKLKMETPTCFGCFGNHFWKLYFSACNTDQCPFCYTKFASKGFFRGGHFAIECDKMPETRTGVLAVLSANS